jgi:dTDP-4-amino-4,6-dideoxygalactose transaminase
MGCRAGAVVLLASAIAARENFVGGCNEPSISTRFRQRIFLSPPHLGGEELRFVHEAFESNYIAPLGPQVDAFEREFCDKVGISHAVAVSSGTAAMHLALQLIGVSPGDEVLTSTLTFIGSATPITFLGAKPVFVDCDRRSWNLNPELLAGALAERATSGRLPKAVVLVHLYGQCADIDPVLDACDRYGVTLIEDAAEALGATYKGRSAGTLGKAANYSFNGNKILTTSGGGMLASDDRPFIEKARFLSQQARDPAPHYEHSEIGYNYRMSNILAAIGRGQLRVLDDRVKRKREIFEYYRNALSGLPGIEFMPEAPYGRSNRWLTCITVDPEKFGADREAVRLALEAENIESRPVWKPMHLQPVFKGCESIGGEVAEDLFKRGLCLPSGTAMTEEDLARIVEVIREMGTR